MKHYLESRKFYVTSDDGKLIYKVGSFETYDNTDYIHINLELVAGWDYVNPDENDIQGWCPSENFVEDVQYESVSQYFLSEGMKEALEWYDYKILDMDKMDSSLKIIIEKHNII